jgi:transposase-like protein
MTSPTNTERSKHHRFPAEIMSHGVWLYDRFPLERPQAQALLDELV